MPWIPRGLREGIVTSRYPRHPDGYGEGFRGTVIVHATSGTPEQLALATRACPTGAITTVHDRPRVDRGRCILCGRCAELAPAVFSLDPSFETAAVDPRGLVVPAGDDDESAVEQVRSQLAGRVRMLRRSVQVRHVDVGSDGADEWEVAALSNPVYDVQRLGIFFTASPRHADLLLATGVGAVGMLGPLRETYDAMPTPKVVVAAGVDAVSGGLLGGGYASRGGLVGEIPVDVLVPGSPATPFGLLYGILLAVGRLTGAKPRRSRTSATRTSVAHPDGPTSSAPGSRS
ncbi:MAG: ferredoxin [Actinomycetota bacterium]|nr:ferredoxin [Actinomycetota bacterium]